MSHFAVETFECQSSLQDRIVSSHATVDLGVWHALDVSRRNLIIINGDATFLGMFSFICNLV